MQKKNYTNNEGIEGEEVIETRDRGSCIAANTAAIEEKGN